MKLTAHAKTMNKTLSNVIAVITALSLVFLQVPIFGLAKEARADTAKEVSAQAEKSGTVDVKFSFDNAYVVVDGQVIAPPASKVTIPAGSDLVFTAEADSGYEVDSVVAKIGGSKTTLATGGGKCRIPGSDLLDGKVSVSVSAVALPEEEEAVEEEVVAPKEKATEGEDAEGGSAEPAGGNDGDGPDEAAGSSAAAVPAGDGSAEAADKSGEAADKSDDAAAKGEEAADGSADAADKSEEAADGSAEAADKSEAAAAVKEPARNTKSTFEYSDNEVTVIAKLSHPEAIPANAEFKVKRVTANSNGYNYDAYMNALNESGYGLEYTADNTLLYDVAFMVDKTDESGKVIAGEKVEYEPEAGTVSIEFKFKNSQLFEGIDATEAAGLEVNHLPLVSSVRDDVASTEAAQSISAKDVIVEALKSDVNINDESVKVVTDSLSLFSLTAGTSGKLNVQLKLVDSTGAATNGTINENLYAYVGGPNNQRITKKFENKGNGLYEVEITGLCDQNGGNNNGRYYPLDNGQSYEVTLFSSANNSAIAEGQQWDGNNRTIYESGDLLSNTYKLRLPTNNTANTSEPYVMTGVSFGGPGSDTAESILGDAINFGIVTEYYNQPGGDAETNVAALVAKCITQTGNDLTNPEEQTFILAEIQEKFVVKGENAFVMTTEDGASKVFPSGNVHFVMDTSHSQAELRSMVNAMLDQGKSQSKSLSGHEDNAGITYKSDQKYYLDIRGRGAGTYYVTLDKTLYRNVFGQDDKLKINKDDNQVIVFNITDDGITDGVNVGCRIGKFSINGVGTDSDNILGKKANAAWYAENGMPEATKSIVFNYIKATKVNTGGSATGIILAPKAEFNLNNTCSGWLICKSINVGSGEWHNTNPGIVKLREGDHVTLKSTKLIDNENATTSGFTFKLERKTATGWEQVGNIVSNNKEAISFDTIDYDGNDFGASDSSKEYVYRISEEAGSTDSAGNSYTPDTTVYYAKVIVSKLVERTTNSETTTFNASTPKYYTDEACTQEFAGLPTFNNRSTGEDTTEATIKKIWVDNENQYNTRPESITVELLSNGVSMNPKKEVTLNASGQWEATVNNLPAGPAYTWREVSLPAGYVLNGSTTAGTITTLTNKLTGKLTLSKELLGATSIDANKEFNFMVTLPNNKDFSETLDLFTGDTKTGTVMFAGGIASVSLKGGETKTIVGLPVGVTYSVTESSADGFQLTSVAGATDTVNNDSGALVGASGAVTPTSETIKFTNKRDTGNLEVSKSVLSAAPADQSIPFTFPIELKAKDGEGNYTVPVAGEFAYETFKGNEKVADKSGTLTFNDEGKGSVSLAGGERVVITGLPTGVQYKVTENTVEGFKLTGVTVDGTEAENGSTGVISTNPSHVAFENTRTTGSLAISKHVTSSTQADHEKEFDFSVTLKDARNNAISGKFAYETNDKNNNKIENKSGELEFDNNGMATVSLTDEQIVTIKNLPVGATFTVTEANGEGFVVAPENTVQGSIAPDTVIEGSLTVGSSAVFTNTKSEDVLVISKKVVSDVPADEQATYTFDVVLTGDAAAGVSGSYQYEAVKGSETTQGTVTFNESKTATVSTVGSQVLTIKGLPKGVNYTVTENTDGISGTFATTSENASGEIGKTEEAASFVNTRKTGKLELSKEVVSGATADSDIEFEFNIKLDEPVSKTYNYVKTSNGQESSGSVTFNEGSITEPLKIKGGEKVLIEGLPAGVGYTVTETGIDGFTLTGITVDKTDKTSEGKAQATIVAGGASTAAFQNTRESGKLELSKIVTGESANTTDSFDFTVALNNADENGEYKIPVAGSFPYTTFDKDSKKDDNRSGNLEFGSNGTANVSLSGGEKVVIDGLPVGVQYTATEANKQGYELKGITVNGTDAATAQGNIEKASDTASAQSVVFENESKSATAHFFAQKILADTNLPLGTADGFTFSFTLKDATSPDSTYSDTKQISPNRAVFKDIKFGPNDIGKTYHFTIQEELPEGVDGSNRTKDGITYDTNVYNVYVAVGWDSDNREITVSYTSDNGTLISEDIENVVTQEATGKRYGFEFTNSYHAIGKVVVETSKTIDTNKKPAAGAYTFALQTPDGKPVKVDADYKVVTSDSANGTPLEATNDADGKVVFHEFWLSQPGVSNYQIVEKTDGAKHIGDKWVKDNVVLDQSVRTVQVNGVDKKNGTIAYTVKYDAENGAQGNEASAGFNNTTFANVPLSLNVKKAIEGRAFTGNEEYTFEISGSEGAPLPEGLSENGRVTIEPAAGDKVANVAFGTINFNANHYSDSNDESANANTYTYTVKEIVPEDAKNASGVTYKDADAETKAAGGFVKDGVIYDSSPRVITVVLSVKDGNLVATAQYDQSDQNVDSAVITNEYEAAGSAELFAQKGLTGRALKANEFYFELSEVTKNADGNDVVTPIGEPVPASKDGKATFDTIAYSLDDVGVHTYLIREVIPGDAVNADNVAYESATDDQKAAGGFVKNGVTYDPSVKTITVNVADSDQHDGTLKVTYGEEEAAKFDGAQFAAFANTYHAASTEATLQVAKNLTGRSWGEAESFGFTLKPVGNAPMAEANATEDTVQVQKDSAADSDVTPSAAFKKITFAEKETYKYTITEQIPGDAVNANGIKYENADAQVKAAGGFVKEGVTYDSRECIATVVVTDDEIGQLHAEVSYKFGDGDTAEQVNGVPTFANTYKAGATTAQIEVAKNLVGRDWGNAEKFEFILEPVEGAPMATAEATSQKVEVTKAEAGSDAMPTAVFDEITYNATGTYRYSIKEVLPNGVNEDNPYLNGVAYDVSTHHVDVVVEDGLKGKLVATVQYDNKPEFADVAACVVTNTYSDTAAVLQAKKTVQGPNANLEEGKYSFQLVNVNEEPLSVIDTKKNDVDGKVLFETLTYTEPGTYKYTISEIIPKGATQLDDGTYIYEGVSYDSRSFSAEVTVVRGEDGKLSSTVKYIDPEGSDLVEGAVPEFVNTKLASSKFEFNKYHFGDEGVFKFEMVSADESGNELSTAVDQEDNATSVIDSGTTGIRVSVKNDDKYENGVAKITFPEIVYAKDGTYRYLVKENEADDENMIADKAQYLVTVEVKNGVAKEPKYELIYEGENYGVTTDLSFYNNSAVTLDFNSLSAQSYADGERVSVYPKATKQLNGDSAQLVGGEFSFELVDNATGEVLVTVTNDENGEIAFFDEEAGDPGLAYDAPRDEPYTYTIREVKGDDATITYDTNTITVTVKVSQDQETGALTADVSYNGAYGEDPIFKNTKEGIDVVVQKVSRSGGEGLEGATYALYMVGANGDALIQEAVSDSKGYITFTDVNLMAGQKYYFKEVAAPSGHTVDPYRTAYFMLSEDGSKLVLAEEAASDGWHSAKENS